VHATHRHKVAAIGLVAGLLSGLFGVGGGILVVPALVLLLHVDQRLANGTSLAAIIPIAAASIVTYIANDAVDWPVAMWLTVGALCGALLGTYFLHHLPVRALTVAFVFVLLLSAIRLFVVAEAGEQLDLGVAVAGGLVVLGFLSGVLAGLLGVGGGVVMVPAMILLFGVAPQVAKGTSLAVIIPTALLATWRNRSKRMADVHLAMVLGVSGVVSAPLGGLLANRISPATSNVLFGALLVALAARLALGLRPATSAPT
jgi:hypothetical protein